MLDRTSYLVTQFSFSEDILKGVTFSSGRPSRLGKAPTWAAKFDAQHNEALGSTESAKTDTNSKSLTHICVFKHADRK